MVKKIELENKKLWELNPIWDVLTDEEKDYICNNASIISFRKNEIIHKEGDIPTHMMMLMKGKLRVYKEGIGNKPQIIRMLKPFDVFAYRAMIAGEEDGYNTSVSAFEPSVVCMVRKEAFLKVIQQNSKFCYQFMVEMARDLGNSDRRTINISQKHIRGRLAEALLTLKDQYGVDDDGATIAMYMSREDLANLSNMTTSNAIRTLSEFAKEEVISIDGRKIKILEEEQLVRISRLG